MISLDPNPTLEDLIEGQIKTLADFWARRFATLAFPRPTPEQVDVFKQELRDILEVAVEEQKADRTILCTACTGKGSFPAACEPCLSSGLIAGTTCDTCQGLGESTVSCDVCDSSGQTPYSTFAITLGDGTQRDLLNVAAYAADNGVSLSWVPNGMQTTAHNNEVSLTFYREDKHIKRQLWPNQDSPEEITYTDPLDRSVDELMLRVRSSRVLKRMEITTIRQLIALQPVDIFKQRNAGRKTLKDIQGALADQNPPLYLSQPPKPEPKPIIIREPKYQPRLIDPSIITFISLAKGDPKLAICLNQKARHRQLPIWHTEGQTGKGRRGKYTSGLKPEDVTALFEPPKPRRPSIGRKPVISDEQWATIPLGQIPDHEAGARLGVSEKAACEARKRLHIPAYNGPKRSTGQIIDWDKQPLGQMADWQLANQLGVSRTLVFKERKKRDIPAIKGAKKWAKPTEITAPRVPWEQRTGTGGRRMKTVIQKFDVSMTGEDIVKALQQQFPTGILQFSYLAQCLGLDHKQLRDFAITKSVYQPPTNEKFAHIHIADLPDLMEHMRRRSSVYCKNRGLPIPVPKGRRHVAKGCRSNNILPTTILHRAKTLQDLASKAISIDEANQIVGPYPVASSGYAELVSVFMGTAKGI